jgi:hypothetical protein
MLVLATKYKEKTNLVISSAVDNVYAKEAQVQVTRL